jgi:hypothetical protein
MHVPFPRSRIMLSGLLFGIDLSGFIVDYVLLSLLSLLLLLLLLLLLYYASLTDSMGWGGDYVSILLKRKWNEVNKCVGYLICKLLTVYEG